MLTVERAAELVEGFARQRILVVGDVLLDHYIYGVVERLNPEAPVPILHAQREEQATGGAGNVAKNVAQLRAGSRLVSVTGDDAGAQRLAAAAQREGYAATLVRDGSRPTIRKVRHLAQNKGYGQQLLRVDFEDVHDIAAAVEEQVIAAVEQALDEVTGVIVSDYAKGVITARLAERLLDKAGQRDILVAADVKPSRARFFTGTSLVSPNLREAHEFVGLNPHEQHVEPEELAKLVYMKMCSDVYLTMSERGMYVYCGGETGTHVPQTASAIEPSGAGDTAVSVLLLALLSGAGEVEAAQLANAACAVVVNKVGSVGLGPDELLAMVGQKANGAQQ